MFYISEKPTEFPGRTIYQVRNNHDHPDTHATDRVVVTTLDETAAMAIAWAMNNTSDLKTVLQNSLTSISVNTDVATRFPDELREALVKGA